MTTCNTSESTRKWVDTGERMIREAFVTSRRRNYDQAKERAKLQAEIADLKWVEPNGQHPMSPALLLKQLIEELALPKVSAVSYSGYYEYPDGPETGTSCVYGVEATYSNAKIRAYFIEIGVGAACFAIDEFPKENTP